jgi:hypothetical protein
MRRGLVYLTVWSVLWWGGYIVAKRLTRDRSKRQSAT